MRGPVRATPEGRGWASPCRAAPFQGSVWRHGVGVVAPLPTVWPDGPQDVIVHVRDVSHPETELQKASVLSTLRGLRLPAPLLDSMVEVHNKVDRVPG